MPDVAFKRKELVDFLGRYDLIRDCIEQKVKECGDKYLPRPNAADTSIANQNRYSSYLQRAVFYNVSGRTLSGLTGAVFAKDAVITVPAALASVEKDANGTGVTLVQEAKEGVKYVLAYGRAGLFIDYPEGNKDTDGNSVPASKADLDAGLIRPTINLYKPDSIINWRLKKKGAKHILSLVVIAETYTKEDDGFKSTEEKQYRVLRIGDDGFYSVEIWREGPATRAASTTSNPPSPVTIDASADQFNKHQAFFPTDGNGNRLDEIPFTFIGAVNNDPEIDAPPLYDMAVLNIAHYRNSADFEEAVYVVGQPTPWMSGLTKEWVKDVFKDQPIPLGSRAVIPLPVDGSAGILQVESNTMAFDAMEHKERQMVALGAKLVEQTTVQRTATEANIENTSETSTLGSSAKNVSLAFQFALEWCAVFVGISETGIEFELNTDFDLAAMNAQDRAETISEWQQGALTFTEMRDVLRKGGVATMDDKEAKDEIDADMATSPAFSTNPANEIPQDNADRQHELAQQALKNKQNNGG